MKKSIKALLLIACVTLFSACSILQAIKLKDCDYSYSYLSDVTFMNMSKREMISLSGMGRVTQALLGKTDKVTLGFTLHMNVHNPNKGTASMEKLFYTVSLDSIMIAEGNNTDPFVVAAGSTAELPLKLNIDLKPLLQKQSYSTLGNAVKNFLGLSDTPTLVTVNLKPVIRVAGASIGVPKSIPLTFKYGGKDDKSQSQNTDSKTATKSSK